VKLVQTFASLGLLIHSSGSSDPEVKRHASVTRESMTSLSLEQNIQYGDHASLLPPNHASIILVSYTSLPSLRCWDLDCNFGHCAEL